MEKFKVKITIVAEISSDEYDNIETIIDELGCESDYDIPSTNCVTVHSTEWRDTELVAVYQA
jgi:hypothetical protein